MKKIKIAKVKLKEITALQEFTSSYMNSLQENIKPQMDLNYFQDILELDLAKELFLLFRKKIESDSHTFTLNLKPAHAVMILYICNYIENEIIKELGKYLTDECEQQDKEDTPQRFHLFVAMKFKNIIDQQVKSLHY